MKRADALKKLVKDMPHMCFITEDGKILQAEEVLRIYDKLDEDIDENITVSTSTKERVPRKPRAKNLDIGKMVALHKAGWSYQAIGEEVGCAPGTAYYKIKEALDAEHK